MKSLVLAIILLSTSLPANAGSVWLIMKEAVSKKGPRFALALEKLEMSDMDQCEEQGAIFVSSERMGEYRGSLVGFECLEGK